MDAIILSGAPPFMLLGPKEEAKLVRQWERKFKTLIVTDPQMQVAGLRAMKIKRFIGASYSALQNEIVLKYMGEVGVSVPFDGADRRAVRSGGPNFLRNALCTCQTTLYRKNSSADGVYIQGGGWQTARVVAMLEKDIGIPIVHATICQAWQIHKRLQVRETAPGYGRLLEELPG